MLSILKWFSIVWSVISIGIVAVSNWMIISHIGDIAGVEPFDVKDNVAVALLLMPGGVAALLYSFFIKK